MSFVGGRCDPEGVNDRHTLHHEVYEELGIPLSGDADSPHVSRPSQLLCLGQLRDYRIPSRVTPGVGFLQARALCS